MFLNRCLSIVRIVSEYRMLLNQGQDGLEDKWCYTKHVDKSVVVCRILCKVPDNLQISKPWNCWSSIGIACEEDWEKGVMSRLFSLCLYSRVCWSAGVKIWRISIDKMYCFKRSSCTEIGGMCLNSDWGLCCQSYHQTWTWRRDRTVFKIWLYNYIKSAKARCVGKKQPTFNYPSVWTCGSGPLWCMAVMSLNLLVILSPFRELKKNNDWIRL